MIDLANDLDYPKPTSVVVSAEETTNRGEIEYVTTQQCFDRAIGLIEKIRPTGCFGDEEGNFSLLDFYVRGLFAYTHPAPLPSDLSLEVRKQLWLSHGCSFNYLYGDAGEMQCNRRPFIDFRHASETEILAKIDAHNRERFAEIQAAALLVGEK